MEHTETKSSEIPIQLLLKADPSESSISSYIDDSWCFAAIENGKTLGACVAKLIRPKVAEIFNVSVEPDHQGCGIGSELLRFALAELRQKGIERVELGTGTFGYQLAFYQRIGFRVESVVKDHFLLNYSEPIFEKGIQLKDMLRLYIQLEKPT